MGNQATQNIRKFGTPWSDQKPVSIYSMEDDANVFDPDAIDPSLQVKDIITGGSYGNYSYADSLSYFPETVCRRNRNFWRKIIDFKEIYTWYMMADILNQRIAGVLNTNRIFQQIFI